MTNDLIGGITLCCGKPGRCPVFKKIGRKYSISDKGQEVFLTKDQLKTLLAVAAKRVE